MPHDAILTSCDVLSFVVVCWLAWNMLIVQSEFVITVSFLRASRFVSCFSWFLVVLTALINCISVWWNIVIWPCTTCSINQITMSHLLSCIICLIALLFSINYCFCWWKHGVMRVPYHMRSLGGCSSPSLRPWATRWINHLCLASVTPDLPSHRASLPFNRYQIILLGERGTCMWISCYLATERLGFEPMTVELQVQRSSH